MSGALSPLVFLIGAAFLGAVGVGVIAMGEGAIARIGYRREALAALFGGRYLAMAAILAALVLLAEWRAVGVVLLVGAALGALDAVLVRRAGGSPRPQLVASGITLAGGLWALALARS